MERSLAPETRLQVRLLILAILLIPVGLAWNVSIIVRLLACLLPLALTGTYRVSTLKGDRFNTRFYFAFIPCTHERCNLPSVVSLHTTYKDAQTNLGTLLIFGPLQFLLGYVFDYLIPCLGGPFEIWLETAKGREILAWNGYSQKHFETNLQLLRNRTGAEVRLR